jgi:hypothetical protein
MFMIHTPQTIQLYGMRPENPAEAPVAEGTITFQHETDDVSKCQMVVAIEDRTYTFTFGTRGPIVETAYADDKTREADKAREKEAAEQLKAQQAEEQRLAKESQEHELRTADDTTDKDLSWDNTFGRPPQDHPDAQPLRTANPPDPRTPPPPFHHLEPGSFGNHGVVNTTESMGEAPYQTEVPGVARNPMMPVEPQHG